MQIVTSRLLTVLFVILVIIYLLFSMLLYMIIVSTPIHIIYINILVILMAMTCHSLQILALLTCLMQIGPSQFFIRVVHTQVIVTNQHLVQTFWGIGEAVIVIIDIGCLILLTFFINVLILIVFDTTICIITLITLCTVY